jgi:hypothetical protein
VCSDDKEVRSGRNARLKSVRGVWAVDQYQTRRWEFYDAYARRFVICAGMSTRVFPSEREGPCIRQ